MTHLFDSFAAHPLVSGGIVLAAIGYVVSLLRSAPQKLGAYVWRRVVSSTEIPEQDPAFDWLEAWLAAHPEAHGTRAFLLRTKPERDLSSAGYPCRSDESRKTTHGKFRFHLTPAPGDHIIRFRGRRLWIKRDRRWFDSAPNGRPFQETLIITALGRGSVIRGLMEAARDLAVAKDPGVAVIGGGGGVWGHIGYRPRRPLESIILPPGMIECLVDDVRSFYRTERWYRDRGVPWQRGYLFAGPPGSGKTSAILGIASELDLNIACASLSSSDMTDQALGRMTASLPDRTLFVIEDVDALFEQRKSSCRVTFSGLLNALDGLAATEGRVLIMTTNLPDKLDGALVRPGRVDRRIDFDYATADQARRLFLWFFRDAELTHRELNYLAGRFGRSIVGSQVGMAAVQEHLLRYRESPATASCCMDASRAPTHVGSSHNCQLATAN